MDSISAIVGASAGAGVNYIANRSLAIENRNWQADMANTAHQREVADLLAAGLNPILSVNRSGAATPGGSSGAFSAPDIANSAADLKMKSEQVENVKKQNDLILAQTKETNARAGVARQQEDQIAADTYLKMKQGFSEDYRPNEIMAHTSLMQLQGQLTGSQAHLNMAATKAQLAMAANTGVRTEILRSVLAEARNKQKISESQYGELIVWTERLLNIGSQIKGLMSSPGGDRTFNKNINYFGGVE